MPISNNEKLVIGYYALYGTYTETSRQTGLTINGVKSIVTPIPDIVAKRKELLEKPITYNGATIGSDYSSESYETQRKKLLEEVLINGTLL